MKPIARLFAAFCLFLATAACTGGEDVELLTLLPGDMVAPPFNLAAADGSRVRLSDYHGKPLIVNFWATWCPPCRAEMPSLQRAWEQLGPEGIGVVAVNVGEDADTINRFREQSPVTFPLLMDLDSRVVDAWSVRGLPTTFVVDSEGQLTFVVTGEREWDNPTLLGLVQALKGDAN